MYRSFDLSKLSSIGIGQVAQVYMIDSDRYPQDHYIIGGATNTLFSPNPPPLMKLSKKFNSIYKADGSLHIGASTPNGRVVSFCKKHNIANLEFLCGLPGTIGGALKMNAGLKEYEIDKYLHSLRTKDGWIQREDIEFSYRSSNIKDVIFEARFKLESGFDDSKIELFRQMRSNQPQQPSAGSVFKNPPNDYAGRLIELVDLKGHRIGALAFSDIHANFMVNLGGGEFQDAMRLIELAKERVLKEFGIDLELEVITL